MPMRDPAHRPEEFSSFVGRTLEVGELRELLHVMRAVTLCGAGGIGKSRLALRLLDAVAAEFPDGAWFVELSDLRQPEHVVPWPSPRSSASTRSRAGRCSTRSPTPSGTAAALLVLDNCEHLIDACASLCQRLLASSPGLQVVATSREPLRVAAEAVWQVPPLGLPPAARARTTTSLRGYDAIRLFAERATAAAPGFAAQGQATSAASRRICRALDGLPLAIELAAAWVRVLSVEQIAARLDRRLALLTSSDRTAPARQQTLRATFDWSYEPALRAGADAAAPAVGPGRLVAGDGRAGVRRREPARRRHRRPADRAGGQVAGRSGARGARAGQVQDAGDGPRVRQRPGSSRLARRR